MKTLNTIIDFSQKGNEIAKTGDPLSILLILAVILAIVAVFIYIIKRKKQYLCASCVLLMLSAVGFLFSATQAQADGNINVVTPEKVGVSLENNINIEDGYIENKGSSDIALSQVAVSNIADNSNTWAIQVAGQIVYQNKGGNTQKIFPALRLQAGQKLDISYSTDMDMEAARNFINKEVVCASFDVYETDSLARATDLKVDEKTNPIDVSNANPTLTWKLVSNLTNQKQTAYQICVKSNNNEVWNSGIVASEDTKCQIPVALSELTDYTWDLTLYDKFGWQMPTANATFSTAYFQNAMPNSKYISYRGPKACEDGDRHISKFTIDFDFIPEKNGDSELASANICFSVINSQNFLRWNYYQTDGKIDLIKQVRKNGDMHDFGRVSNVCGLDDFINKKHHTTIDVDGTKVITTLDGKIIDTDETFTSPIYLYKMGFYTKQAMTGEVHEVSYVANVKVVSDGKDVYVNDFSKDLIEFNHPFTAKIVERDNGRWLMLGNADTFSRPEPLVEWDNDTGNLPAFRKEFASTKQIKSAKLYTAGLGCYEAYINGERVGNYQLQNNFTENKETQFYLVNDVTKLIQENNTISAAVGDAWWADTCAAYSGAEDAFRAELIIKYADGTTQQINTDETWKSAPANPITKSCIFGGETYDSRTDTNWRYNGFDDKDWRNAITNNEFSGTLQAWIGNKIVERDDLLLKPKEVYSYNQVVDQKEKQYGKVVKDAKALGASYTIKPGDTLVVDFGQNSAGWESFQVSGAKDTHLTIKHAEVLNESNGDQNRGNDGPEGSGYYANLRCAKATTNYILNGNTENYHPSMTFYGYRYIEFSADDEVTINNIQSHVITSVEEDNGTFETSNPELNQLVHNAKWGMYSNYLGVPTDCPQRDERQGWTADTQVFSEAGAYLSNAKTFLQKFCYDMKDAQQTHRADGAYPGMCPSGGFFFDRDCGCFGWADAGIILPYTLYSMYGDKSVIENNWDSMEHYVKDFIKGNCTKTHHGAVRGWGDHLAPRPEDNDDLVKDILCSEFYCYDLQMMDEMQMLLDKKTDYYKDELEREKKWFLKNYFVDNKLTKNTTQTVCLYALYLHLIPDDYVSEVFGQLLNDIETQGNKLGTGFLGTKILLDVLVENGRPDVAYQLLLNRDCPSWLYPVTQGATTFWERWNSYTKEEGYGQLAGMNSFNHYAYGAVIAWMYKYMAGIQSDFNHPGFKDIIMKPIPIKSINWVKAKFNSDYGPISTESKYDGSKWEYNFSIPSGSTALLTIPMDFSNITVNGKELKDLKAEIDGIELTKEGKLKINSGSYALIALP